MVVINAISAATPSAYRCVYRTMDVTVKFNSSGSVSSVDSYSFRGDERNCVLRAFQSNAHVPPFSNPSYSIDTTISN